MDKEAVGVTNGCSSFGEAQTHLQIPNLKCGSSREFTSGRGSETDRLFLLFHSIFPISSPFSQALVFPVFSNISAYLHFYSMLAFHHIHLPTNIWNWIVLLRLPWPSSSTFLKLHFLKEVNLNFNLHKQITPHVTSNYFSIRTVL